MADIGLPDHLPELDDIPLTLVDAAIVGRLLPERPIGGHKGTFGKAMVVAGSLNYTGAAYLAAHAAYRVGAGLVTVAAPQIIIPTLAGMLPEATWLLLPHDMGVINEPAVKVLRKEIDGYSELLLGPGCREPVTGDCELLQPKEEIRRSRDGFVPIAPQKKTFGASCRRWSLMRTASTAGIVRGLAGFGPAGDDPHAPSGQFARLTGLEIAEVQANRLALAGEKAAHAAL